MKSYGVTIQMKPLQQYFHMVLFILIVCSSNFGAVDEILWCDHSNETSFPVHYFHRVLFVMFGMFGMFLSVCFGTSGSERVRMTAEIE